MIRRKPVTLTRMSDTPDTDATAPRLIELWLKEAEEHANGPEGTAQERGAAAQARRAWEDGGRFTADAARELADWATARTTRTAFNEDEGPSVGTTAPALTVGEKDTVHRWLAEQEYRL